MAASYRGTCPKASKLDLEAIGVLIHVQKQIMSNPQASFNRLNLDRLDRIAQRVIDQSIAEQAHRHGD
jgi:hypothetical protein